MVKLKPMKEAPEDRVILALFRDDAFPKESRFAAWNGLWVSVHYQGRTVTNFDLGWSIMGPTGHGGFHSDQFVGFVDPNAMPSQAEA